MPDELTEERAEEAEQTDDRVFTGYGVASAVLGLLAVAAVVLSVLVWSAHRSEVGERSHQTRVLQTAADWTDVLINMKKDTVEPSMQHLRENTIGELNADFDSAVDPFRRLVQKLQTTTTGQVDSVSIESLHHATPGPEGGAAMPAPPNPELSAVSSRTDTVLVVATSVSENAGGQQPQTVRWNLRLDVSEVDGKLMISRLELIR